MTTRPLSNQDPLSPFEQLANVINALCTDELFEAQVEIEEKRIKLAKNIVRTATRKALGEDAIGLLGPQQSVAGIRIPSLEELADFVIDLAYERFPDAASLIGDGAIRALFIGNVTFASPATAYRLPVGGSVQIIADLVTIAKATYDILSTHYDCTEGEIIALVTRDLTSHGALPEAIDDNIVQFVVRRTIEYTDS